MPVILIALLALAGCAPAAPSPILPLAALIADLPDQAVPTPVPAPKARTSPLIVFEPQWEAPLAAPVPTPAPSPVAVARPAALRSETRVPVLMYHHIAVPPEGADTIRRDLSVPPANFVAQMTYFAGEGYSAVRLADVYDALMSGRPLAGKPIVFTFDDGYDDHFENALPILQRYNFVGTFYIATGLLNRPGYMTWEQVVALSQAGMDIQSHSVTHPSLKRKPVGFVRWEAAESKRALEDVLGRPVLFFCYPGGAYDARTIRVLREVGYVAATTTRAGARQRAAAPYEWPRVRVRGTDSVSDLAERIRVLTAVR